MPGHNKHTKTPEAQQKSYPKLGNSIQHLDWVTNTIKTKQNNGENNPKFHIHKALLQLCYQVHPPKIRLE